MLNVVAQTSAREGLAERILNHIAANGSSDVVGLRTLALAARGDDRVRLLLALSLNILFEGNVERAGGVIRLIGASEHPFSFEDGTVEARVLNAISTIATAELGGHAGARGREPFGEDTTPRAQKRFPALEELESWTDAFVSLARGLPFVALGIAEGYPGGSGWACFGSIRNAAYLELGRLDKAFHEYGQCATGMSCTSGLCSRLNDVAVSVVLRMAGMVHSDEATTQSGRAAYTRFTRALPISTADASDTVHSAVERRQLASLYRDLRSITSGEWAVIMSIASSTHFTTADLDSSGRVLLSRADRKIGTQEGQGALKTLQRLGLSVHSLEDPTIGDGMSA